ncbi:MAG: hypothetical protein HY704_13770 [Gemmatimonadetes bacterium]|nr:hypothetical protein [Gemmatimonadota bacterium]
MFVRWIGALGLALPLAACFSYVPAELESIAPGEMVRARVSPQGAARLEEALGDDNRLLEGEVLEKDDGGLLLSVPVSTRQWGFQMETLKQNVRVSQGEIVEVERKRFDRLKTWGSVGVSTAAVTVLAWRVLGGKSGGETAGKPPPVEDVLIPLLSIRFP